MGAPSSNGAARRAALDLLAFIDAAPSPFHVVEEAARRLRDGGFQEVSLGDAIGTGVGGWFLRRAGALVAWSVPDADLAPGAPFRIVGAHTDSPNLRIKPRPDTGRAGYRQLGVEIYGGALLNSWLDRDLGLSGRVVTRGTAGSGATESVLLRIDRPLLRVPQLAIHLDREINQKGLLLNPQQHLVPVWGLGNDGEGEFRRFVADELDLEPDDVLAWDLMAHDLTPSTLLGHDEEFVSAPRLDDLCSCWAGTETLLQVGSEAGGRVGRQAGSSLAVLCLFDHEEVGSVSDRGAGSPLLRDTLERVVLARGGTRAEFLTALASSGCASADMAHAVHPNYADRSEPGHQIELNGGPVIKVNVNQRYATDAMSAALFRLACEEANVPCQEYVHRSDLPCGSTIGPLTSANLGVSTVDVGVAQLAMHSSRELAGSHDPASFVAALAAFLS